MTDRTESVIQNILKKANGGSKTVNDLFDLILAVNEDQDDAGMARHTETLELLKSHCAEAARRDSRIEDLEDWREEQARTCTEKLKRLIDEDHTVRHAAHMESQHPVVNRRITDADGSDYLAQREEFKGLNQTMSEMTFKIKLMWGGLGFFIAIVVSFLVNYGLDQLLHP
jgi:hypothetical protein